LEYLIRPSDALFFLARQEEKSSWETQASFPSSNFFEILKVLVDNRRRI